MQNSEDVDLGSIEEVARAAAEVRPDLWHVVASSGAPAGSAAARHVEANDPATTLALVRHIRELKAALAAAAREVDEHNYEHGHVTPAASVAQWRELAEAPVRRDPPTSC